MSIIERISKDEQILQACKNIDYTNYKDLYQELFIIICEKGEEEISTIYEHGYFQFWVVRTLMNMTSPTGKFYKKYKIINEEHEATERVSEREEEERHIEEAAYQKIEQLLKKYEERGREDFGWYRVNLLKMYSEIRNATEISRLTGIPRKTIKHDLDEFCRELRQHISISSD